ncbi:hypothetical protein BJP25_05085 [Actinokineospora bangkokensis]|uniref:Uncharacterized protein n=1 Tax=Actinokineospora bangkokensis TaxID=1193682 RepID=A0A1Q9LBT7_9PSEU|nr:hypothetical protein BJP25_05085 [Actinokineospora bangkokensis]
MTTLLAATALAVVPTTASASPQPAGGAAGSSPVAGTAAALSRLTGSAGAAPQATDSSATVGGGMALFGIDAVDLGPLAPCAAGGPTSATTPGAASDNQSVVYGSGSTTCATDPATGESRATATGRTFKLDALKPYGGPAIRVSSYSATCSTTPNGSRSSITLGGVTGLDLPTTIPQNFSTKIPGATPTDPPLALVTANSVVTPEPGDGSATVSALRIQFFPQGGQGSGTITLATVTCTPDSGD